MFVRKKKNRFQEKKNKYGIVTLDCKRSHRQSKWYDNCIWRPDKTGNFRRVDSLDG